MIRRSKLSSLHHPLAMQTKMRQEFQRNWEEKERHPDEAREDVPYRNLIEIETCAVPQLDLKIIHFDDLARLQTRHTESWEAVHKFADERMKVWSINGPSSNHSRSSQHCCHGSRAPLTASHTWEPIKKKASFYGSTCPTVAWWGLWSEIFSWRWSQVWWPHAPQTACASFCMPIERLTRRPNGLALSCISKDCFSTTLHV